MQAPYSEYDALLVSFFPGSVNKSYTCRETLYASNASISLPPRLECGSMGPNEAPDIAPG